MEASFLGLIHNTALLLAVALLFDLVSIRWRPNRSWLRQVVMGIALGGIGIVVMLTPWKFVPGVVFDTRSVVIGIAGLFFGAVPASIAMAMTVTLRLYQGGGGAITGACVILASGLLGIAWRKFRHRPLVQMSWVELYGFGLLVHVVMLLLMLTLPWETALGVLQRITLPVLFIYPAGTVLLGILLVGRLKREQDAEALRESEERLELALSGAGEGIIDWDLEQDRIVVNPIFSEMLGYGADEFPRTGRELLELVHPDDRAAGDAAFRELLAGRALSLDLQERFLSARGEWRWILARGRIVRRDAAGRPLRYIGTHVDITERKRAEDEIQRLNEELEQRVAQRTAELQASNRELEAFSYSVSHDLRAPLRAINGFAEILEENAAHLSPESRQYLDRIRDNALQMGRLVDGLLEFSRIGRREPARMRVSVAEIVCRCLEELQVEAAGRRVETVVGELPDCEADPQLLKQVWANLLANAFKFTRGRDPARIEIGALDPAQLAERNPAVKEWRRPVYYVRDNGVGFDMRYAEKLFGVFQRLHRAEDYEGTGVGLAIVQRILHRHGGMIWAEAEPERGATFYLTL